jgi:hypothetical protein
MDPVDLALAALLGISLFVSMIVLAMIALVLEAVMFGLGHGGKGDGYDGR